MTIKPEVLAAMDKVERNAMLGGYWPITELEWQTIRAELLAMDAENEGLRADLQDADERSAVRNRERTEAVMRAKKTDALLRDVSRYLDPRHYSDAIKRIDAHFSETRHD